MASDLYIADGRRLLRLERRHGIGGAAASSAPITALCAASRTAALRSRSDGREVRVYATPSAEQRQRDLHRCRRSTPSTRWRSRTTDTLIATDGSTTCGIDDWARDLLERGRTGRVFKLDPGSKAVTRIGLGLRYAFGACAARRRHAGQRELAASPRSSSRAGGIASASCSTTCRSIRRGCRRPPAAASGSPRSPRAPSWSSSCCARPPTGAA